MVADVLNMEPEQLLVELKRIRRDHADDPDYLALRGALPEDWPV